MAFMRACMTDGAEPAPSVETPLHSVLPHRYIVHTHDFATQALTDTPRPEALVREALGDDAAYVDYVRPGFPLARAVIDLGPVAENARGLVLGRHGLIAWGDTAKACYENLHLLINRALRFIADRREAQRPAPSAEIKIAAPPPERRRELARAILPALRGRLSRERGVILHYDDSPRRWRSPAPRAPASSRRAACRRPSTSCAAGASRCTSTPTCRRCRRRRRTTRSARALDQFAAHYRETFARSGPKRRDARAGAARGAAARPGAGDGDEGQGQRRRRQPLLSPRDPRRRGGRGAGRLPLSRRRRRPSSSSTGRWSWPSSSRPSAS